MVPLIRVDICTVVATARLDDARRATVVLVAAGAAGHRADRREAIEAGRAAAARKALVQLPDGLEAVQTQVPPHFVHFGDSGSGGGRGGERRVFCTQGRHALRTTNPRIAKRRR